VVNLPIRLEDSLDAFEKDKVLEEALGSEFVKLFPGNDDGGSLPLEGRCLQRPWSLDIFL
jgi:hypothetical protein